MIGRELAHYKVVGKLGSGGMGDVYVAEDTKLGRQVALKVLPPELEERGRERFEREAKAIAALDHPNIVHVYSVEEADGVHFITMQLVHGKTLTELLPRNGLPYNQFFEIAIPLVDAVAAAHQEGITHRDLKPDNIMVADDGRVKVLDFGLAKAKQQIAGFADSEGPTQAATREGHIVGTPAYMSPEQAEGKNVDARSDIFSLGVVLYEMLTGERPFIGDSPTAVLSSVLKDTARPVAELRGDTPRELARLVHRCLSKDPRGRYQSAIDVEHDLSQTKQDIDSGELLPAGQVRRRTEPLPALALTLAVIGAAAWWLMRDGDTTPAPLRLANPIQVSSALDVEAHATWSPDGERLAYHAGTGYVQGDHDIWIAQVGSGDAVNVTSEYRGEDRLPSWSPDGRQIAFLSDRDGDWGLYSLPAIGGSARSLLPLPEVARPESASQWSQDGARLAVSLRQRDTNVVILLTLDSLETDVIELPDHDGHVIFGLSWSPDEGHFAYVEGRSGGPETLRLWTYSIAEGTGAPLTDGSTNVRSPSWSPDGRKVFYLSNRGGSMDLWEQSVSGAGLPMGEPVALTQGIGMRDAAFTLDGKRLAYNRGAWVRTVMRAPVVADRAVTWADTEPVISEQAYVEFIDLSPDGELLAVSSDRAGNQDLWILPAAGGQMRQLTTDPTPDWAPSWSPDGSQIAFYALRSGNRDIWVMPSRGGPATQLTSHPAVDNLPQWSPTRPEIGFTSQRSGTYDAWIVDADGSREPERAAAIFHLDEVMRNWTWTPDGDGILFTKKNSFFVVSRDGGEPKLVFEGGELELGTPRFSPDGETLYFAVQTGLLENRDLWKISVKDGTLSRATKLEGRRGSFGYQYDTDGRYLYLTWAEDTGDIWVMDVVQP